MKPSDKIKYHSRGGGLYDAEVKYVRDDGTVDIDVFGPWVDVDGRPVNLRKITVAAKPKPGQCALV